MDSYFLSFPLSDGSIAKQCDSTPAGALEERPMIHELYSEWAPIKYHKKLPSSLPPSTRASRPSFAMRSPLKPPPDAYVVRGSRESALHGVGCRRRRGISPLHSTRSGCDVELAGGWLTSNVDVAMNHDFSCCSLDGMQKGVRMKVCPKYRHHKMALSMVYTKSLLMNVYKTWFIKSCAFLLQQ